MYNNENKLERTGECRSCEKKVNTDDVRRIYGICSHVYMLGYCSAACYTKETIK